MIEKSSQNLPKILPKSSQNRWEIKKGDKKANDDLRCAKNAKKMQQNASWKHLGASLPTENVSLGGIRGPRLDYVYGSDGTARLI